MKNIILILISLAISYSGLSQPSGKIIEGNLNDISDTDIYNK